VNGFPRDVLDSTVSEIWTLDLSVTSSISLITEPSVCVRIKFGRSEIDRHLARHTKKLHRKGRLRLSALNSVFTYVLCYVMYLKNSAIFDCSMSLLRVLRYSRNALYYGISNNLMLHLKARHLYSTKSGIPQLQYRFCHRAGIQPIGRRLSLRPQTFTDDQTVVTSPHLLFNGLHPLCYWSMSVVVTWPFINFVCFDTRLNENFLFSNDFINECRAVFGILPIKQQMQIRKVRFLQNVIDSDNAVCSSFVRDATSELLCLCNAYSANERNIIERIIQSDFAF